MLEFQPPPADISNPWWVPEPLTHKWFVGSPRCCVRCGAICPTAAFVALAALSHSCLAFGVLASVGRERPAAQVLWWCSIPIQGSLVIGNYGNYGILWLLWTMIIVDYPTFQSLPTTVIGKPIHFQTFALRIARHMLFVSFWMHYHLWYCGLCTAAQKAKFQFLVRIGLLTGSKSNWSYPHYLDNPRWLLVRIILADISFLPPSFAAYCYS